jgi:hypothetical protein
MLLYTFGHNHTTQSKYINSKHAQIPFAAGALGLAVGPLAAPIPVALAEHLHHSTCRCNARHSLPAKRSSLWVSSAFWSVDSTFQGKWAGGLGGWQGAGPVGRWTETHSAGSHTPIVASCTIDSLRSSFDSRGRRTLLANAQFCAAQLGQDPTRCRLTVSGGCSNPSRRS